MYYFRNVKENVNILEPSLMEAFCCCHKHV